MFGVVMPDLARALAVAALAHRICCFVCQSNESVNITIPSDCQHHSSLQSSLAGNFVVGHAQEEVHL